MLKTPFIVSLLFSNVVEDMERSAEFHRPEVDHRKGKEEDTISVHPRSNFQEEILIAGFGGQGILLMGKLLAYSGMLEGNNVTWLPSYGPEMRGGTANCTVVLSSKRISSPYVTEPTSMIVMNNPSLDRFESALRPKGVLLINSSMIKREVTRRAIKVVKIPANNIAQELGFPQVANMVALGAFIKAKPIISLESAQASLDKILPVHRQDMIAANNKALQRGFDEPLNLKV